MLQRTSCGAFQFHLLGLLLVNTLLSEAAKVKCSVFWVLRQGSLAVPEAELMGASFYAGVQYNASL